MDEPQTVATTEPPLPDGQASAPPLAFTIALWVPVFAVVTWFFMRLFGGRWADEPEPSMEVPADPTTTRSGGSEEP